MKVTTIIPTLCEESRADALLRAIESIQKSSCEEVKILIVVNGQRFDCQLLDRLRSRDDLEVIQIAEGSLTKAHLVGRKHVCTDYFSFLDDDDEYLPGALDIRRTLLEQDLSLDLVVTNGYLSSEGDERLVYSRMSIVSTDPLSELFMENWLHNCNHLFRSASVSISYFEDPHPYMEWTWLGFRLAFDGKKVAATNTPTFKYNDTPGSLSKTQKFVESRVGLYERMLSMPINSEIRSLLRKRLCNAWHDLSVIELKKGNRRKAFSAHLRSLIYDLYGLRYLFYTRHIFF